jgi:hypothetical protein
MGVECRQMPIRAYKPDQFFRASIDTMDDLEDCKTYVAEYFCFKIPRHGEAVFTDLADAEEFLFQVYAETTPDLPPAERRSGWLRANGAPVEVNTKEV